MPTAMAPTHQSALKLPSDGIANRNVAHLISGFVLKFCPFNVEDGATGLQLINRTSRMAPERPSSVCSETGDEHEYSSSSHGQ